MNYRYGFNNKEKDDEVKGAGNQIDYGFRVYDPRLGRFLSVDPIMIKYPQIAPYEFASNMPIWASDLDGKEASKETIKNKDGSTTIKVTIDINIIDATGRDLKPSSELDPNTLEPKRPEVKYNKGKLTNDEIQNSIETIKKAIPDYFNGYDPNTNTHYEYAIGTVNIIQPENYKEGSPGINVLLVDQVFDYKSNDYDPYAVGRAMEIGLTVNNSIQFVAPGLRKSTAAHEFGHVMGLQHVPVKTLDDLNRLMHENVITPKNAPTDDQLIITNGERAMTIDYIKPKNASGGGGGKLANYPIE